MNKLNLEKNKEIMKLYNREKRRLKYNNNIK